MLSHPVQHKRIYQNVSDAFTLPKIIQVDKNLFVAKFSLMKLLPAKYIIQEAIRSGEIDHETTVVATSSGTFALGVGMVCAELGLSYRVFGDPAIKPELIGMLNDLGGSVHLSMDTKHPGAYQKQRLEALNAFLQSHDNCFWMRQYDNVDNSKAYHAVGEHLLNTLGDNINLVGPVGSGGSSCGTMSFIRQQNAHAKLIGVDTFCSVLFGQPDGKRNLRGLGNSLLPKNLNHTLFDEIHWVGANDAHFWTRELYRKKALFCGPTTGAAYQVSRYLAAKNPSETYVFFAPDEGYRYLDTVYNDNWLEKQKYFSRDISIKPQQVSTPLDASQFSWASMNWNRMTYEKRIHK